MTASMPLVSVVTPVYNGEQYMAECIESVLAQTYDNWEYLLVNNCSTDRTREIAQSYASRDSRIRVHDNSEFLDVIGNSNRAFAVISPESRYCKMLHADDWLFPECLERMVEVGESNPSAGVIGSYGLAGKRVVCDGLSYPSTLLPGREVSRLCLLGKAYVFWSPSSLLIRSDLVRSRNPFYRSGELHADVETLYEILQHSDFGFVHQVLTYIRMHEDSATSQLAAPMNRLILSNFQLLTRFGPVFLTERELRERFKAQQREYYFFLAKSLFGLREREFWEYHQKKMRDAGYPVSSLRLLKACIQVAVESQRVVMELLLQGVKRRLRVRRNAAAAS